jgi:hypothetical protein
VEEEDQEDVPGCVVRGLLRCFVAHTCRALVC